jgi:hypothetical protein
VHLEITSNSAMLCDEGRVDQFSEVLSVVHFFGGLCGSLCGSMPSQRQKICDQKRVGKVECRRQCLGLFGCHEANSVIRWDRSLLPLRLYMSTGWKARIAVVETKNGSRNHSFLFSGGYISSSFDKLTERPVLPTLDLAQEEPPSRPTEQINLDGFDTRYLRSQVVNCESVSVEARTFRATVKR